MPARGESMRRIVLICVGIVALAAPAGAQNGGACPEPSSTWDLMQRGIFERHGCTTSYCHGETKLMGMDLRAGASYDSIVGVPSTLSPERYHRIAPGQPERSYLWLTMAKRTLQMTTVPGEAMPIGRPRLSRDELEAMRLWIVAGAPATGFVPGVASLMDLCPRPLEADYGYVPACDSDDSDLLLPDLVTDTPTDVRLTHRDGRRVVEFSTSVVNVGDGPLVIQATFPPEGTQPVGASQIISKRGGGRCAVPAGQLVYFEEAGYWAVADVVDFELRRDDPYAGALVAKGAKRAFCFLDTDPLRAADDRQHQFEAHCEDGIARMGISSGYKDTYHRSRPGQWLDIDDGPDGPVEEGTYYLVNVTDPKDRIWEVDDTRENNVGYSAVRIRALDGASRRATPTPTPPGRRGPSATPAPPWRYDRPPRPERPTRAARPTRTARGAPALEPSPTRAVYQRPPRPERPTRTPRGASAATPQPTAAAPRPPRLRPERPPRPTRVPRG